MIQIRLGSGDGPLQRLEADYVAAALCAPPGGVEVISERLDPQTLEAGLREGRLRCAVNPMIELAHDDVEPLGVLAIPRRADPRDALVVGAPVLERFAAEVAADPARFDPRDVLAALPEGARVRVGHVRVAAQLRRARPDLHVDVLAAPIEQQLADLDAGRVEAAVLPSGTLDWLELGDRVHRRLDSPWLGAPGQGAIGLRGRLDDFELRELALRLDDRPSRLEVTAERALAALLGVGLDAAFGARARASQSRLHLEAVISRPDGSEVAVARREGEATGQGARRLAAMLARDLWEAGAERLLEEPPRE